LGRLLTYKNKNINKGSLRYNLRTVYSGRLFADVYELAKTTRKLENYELSSMINYFYPKFLPKKGAIE